MEDTPGSVIIAPEVLTTVVRQVVLETPGVVGLNSTLPGRMSRVFRGPKSTGGIDVQVEDGAVTVDVYITAEREMILLPLGQTLQHEISRAISDSVGMPVRAVNIHIEDVSDPFGAKQ